MSYLKNVHTVYYIEILIPVGLFIDREYAYIQANCLAHHDKPAFYARLVSASLDMSILLVETMLNAKERSLLWQM